MILHQWWYFIHVCIGIILSVNTIYPHHWWISTATGNDKSSKLNYKTSDSGIREFSSLKIFENSDLAFDQMKIATFPEGFILHLKYYLFIPLPTSSKCKILYQNTLCLTKKNLRKLYLHENLVLIWCYMYYVDINSRMMLSPLNSQWYANYANNVAGPNLKVNFQFLSRDITTWKT